MTAGDEPFPICIGPGRCPGGVVVHLYRWADRAFLRERLLTMADPVEAMAGVDADTFNQAGTGDGVHHAVVMLGYDGDDGTLLEGTLVTDDDDLAARHGRRP